jgi:hypothetical protein
MNNTDTRPDDAAHAARYFAALYDWGMLSVVAAPIKVYHNGPHPIGVAVGRPPAEFDQRERDLIFCLIVGSLDSHDWWSSFDAHLATRRLNMFFAGEELESVRSKLIKLAKELVATHGAGIARMAKELGADRELSAHDAAQLFEVPARGAAPFDATP